MDAQAPGGGVSGTLIDQVADWLMGRALGEAAVEDVFTGTCARLLAAGIPLSRAMISFRTLHPLVATTSLVWRRGGAEADRQHFLHGEAFTSDQWLMSPMHHLFSTGLPHLRRRLAGDTALLDFPVLEELRDEGNTDYYAYGVAFPRGGEPGPDDNGILGSWCTDRRAGFTDEDLRQLIRIQRRLAVACKVQIKDQIARNVLDTYLGPDAGRQVLEGRIRRGDGSVIYAAIWYSDLRGSTRLADTLPGSDFLATVNGYFECTAGAVLAHGGEVLRFIGDAVLAIFPVRERGPGEREACEAALAAAREAGRRMDALNAARRDAGLEALDFGLGLHVGEVMYGNIGVPERLEFSVIGPAANEVARLEALSKQLGRRVLVSGELARLVDGAGLESLGQHALRGVGTPLEVLTPR